MNKNNKIDYIIRHMKKSDYSKVPQVYASSFNEPAWEISWYDIPEFDEDSVWVAVAENELTSFLISFYSEKYKTPYISVVATSKKYKRSGMGEALVNAALLYWKDKGYPEILVHTDSFRDDAIAFYNKCGFIETQNDGETVTFNKKL